MSAANFAEIDSESRAFDAGDTGDQFFSQDDWSFQLDTMQDRSVEALQAHLDKMPENACPETVGALRKYLLDATSLTFTNFVD